MKILFNNKITTMVLLTNFLKLDLREQSFKKSGVIHIEQSNIVTIDFKGNLKFLIPPDFDREFLLSSWNQGLKCYFKEDKTWKQESVDSGFTFISDDNEAQEDDPVSIFIQQIPGDVASLIKPYHYRQFIMLQLMSQNPKLIDVFKHSPTLFWMVVAEAAERKWKDPEIVRVLHLKRTMIIEEIIGKSCAKAIKFIEKIVLKSGDINEFDLIKKCLLDLPLIESFLHEKSILIQVLSVAQKKGCFINTKILRNEIEPKKTSRSQLIKFRKYEEIIRDIERMAQLLNRPLPVNYFKNYTSEEALNRLHNNWITRYNGSQIYQDRVIERDQRFLEKSGVTEKEQAAPFPLCPLGDFANLIQIKDYSGLNKEGIQMKHCVGSYFQRAFSGSAYYYKLLSPERATVEIKMNLEKVTVTQFKLKGNKKPSQESYDYLYELFHNNR